MNDPKEYTFSQLTERLNNNKKYSRLSWNNKQKYIWLNKATLRVETNENLPLALSSTEHFANDWVEVSD